MIFDAWIYANKTEWDALDMGEQNTSVYANAVTGFWNDLGALQVYNVIGTVEEIQSLVDQLTTTPIVYAWEQGNGMNTIDDWEPDPDNVLAVMQDVPVDETTSVPATFEKPNWGHSFLGQQSDVSGRSRIFSGTYDNSFAGDFF